MRRRRNRLIAASISAAFALLIVVGGTVSAASPSTLAGALPPSPPSDSEILVSIEGVPGYKELVVDGTNGPDQIQIDQNPVGGAYVIEANRPIRTTSSQCRVVAENSKAVECHFKPGVFAVSTYGGADSYGGSKTNACRDSLIA